MGLINKKTMDFSIKHIEDWQNIVEQILPKIKHNILLLRGNLGAGKTTFSQILVAQLGSTDEVSSPTYSIVNEYDSPKGKIFHFDLYRMKSLEEVMDIGIEEYIENSFLCIIEWPDIYEEELAHYPFHEMIIENTGTERQISFK